MHVYIVVLKRIAQKAHFEFSREIVVERESATISYLVTLRIESYLRYQPIDYAACLLSQSLPGSVDAANW